MRIDTTFSSATIWQLAQTEIFKAPPLTDLGIAFNAFDSTLLLTLHEAGNLAEEASKHFSSEQVTNRYHYTALKVLQDFNSLLDAWDLIKPRIRPFSVQTNRHDSEFDNMIRAELTSHGFDRFIIQLKEFAERLIDFLEAFINSQAVFEMTRASENIRSVEAELKVNFEKLTEVRDAMDLLTSDIENQKIKAEELVKEIGLLPTKQQVENYASIFKNESNDFRLSAKSWMTRLVSLIVIVIVIGIINVAVPMFYELPELSVQSLVQVNLAKLIVLSCLFFGISLSAKSYKVAKHNEVLNKHRSNAISSFDAFVMSVGTDENVKNAILLEVTRTIFSNQQTGFISGETDDSPSKIIEVIKNVQSKG